MKLKGLTINFLGDSITEGYGTTAPDKVFHQIIQEKYNMHRANNYGVSSTRIARQIVPTPGNTKADLSFELRAEVMDRNADAVVVFGGTNDYGHGDAPFGKIDDEDIFTFCGAVNSLITKLKMNFPNAKIVFMTPIHRIDEKKPSIFNSKVLEDYVDAIIEICERRDVAVINLFKINPFDPNDKELVPDGVHPSDKGHGIIARIVAEELLKIKKIRVEGPMT